MKYGFNVNTNGWVFNPTEVFCNNRDQYYTMRGVADTGATAGSEAWCTYVLQGIRDELRKVDILTDYGYLTDPILLPGVNFAFNREWITQTEEYILVSVVKMKVVKSGDIAQALSVLTTNQRTYQIKSLIEQGMLLPVSYGLRQYTISFFNH